MNVHTLIFVATAAVVANTCALPVQDKPMKIFVNNAMYDPTYTSSDRWIYKYTANIMDGITGNNYNVTATTISQLTADNITIFLFNSTEATSGTYKLTVFTDLWFGYCPKPFLILLITTQNKNGVLTTNLKLTGTNGNIKGGASAIMSVAPNTTVTSSLLVNGDYISPTSNCKLQSNQTVVYALEKISPHPYTIFYPNQPWILL